MNAYETTRLDLPSGPVLANLHDGLLYARGIPYAEAKRFEKPVPTTWATMRDCTSPATIAPQPPTRIAPVIGNITGGRIQSEDCLHVTVASPINAECLPVMVFLHGGAYISGGGDLDAYNPCDLARGGVIAVNVSYRVWLFGCLPIPGIAPANLGLLDQIEALKWVKINVASFGGDPARVTVYGHSAGGDSVVCLLLCEETRALFHRCIIQSAPMGRFDESQALRAQMTVAMGECVSRLSKSVRQPLSTDECLALLPDVMTTAKSIHESIVAFAPILGEEPLPPLSQMKQKLQTAAKLIPVFIGYTAEDGSAFSNFDPTHNTTWYQEEVFQNGSDWLREIIADAAGRCPSYEFVWHPDGSKWGSTHCIEIPFLLGGMDGWGSAPMLDGCDKEKVITKLGAEMKRLWIAFAYGADLDGRRFVIDEDFVYSQYEEGEPGGTPWHSDFRCVRRALHK